MVSAGAPRAPVDGPCFGYAPDNAEGDCIVPDWLFILLLVLSTLAVVTLLAEWIVRHTRR